MEHYKEIHAKIKKGPAWRTKPYNVVRISRSASECCSALDLYCRINKLHFRVLDIHKYRITGTGTIPAHH